VWREKEKWTGPFKLISIDTAKQVCIVELLSGPTQFRTTQVKPYLREQPEDNDLGDNKNKQPEGNGLRDNKDQ
jgi:hypothetical protein